MMSSLGGYFLFVVFLHILGVFKRSFHDGPGRFSYRVLVIIFLKAFLNSLLLQA